MKKPQRNFHIDFIRHLLTREAAQRKSAPLNWLRHWLCLAAFPGWGQTRCVQKGGLFENGRHFLFRVEWLPFLVAWPGNYVPTCTVRARLLLPPSKGCTAVKPWPMCVKFKQQLEQDKIGFLCVFELGVEGCLHFCGQFIPSSF